VRLRQHSTTMSRSLEAVLAKLSLATCLDRPMLVKQVQVEEMLISMATLVELILEKATFSELVICRSPPKETRARQFDQKTALRVM
jgi:hypothetical protein